MNDQERAENKLPRIYDISISEIDPFPDHPFQVRMDEDMQLLVESIKERGLITPITLRNNNMIDRSDLVVAYVERKSGGPYRALEYAEKTNKKIINIAESL